MSSFDGEIRVASTIIDYLSSGLYKSPAACLKELVNNSYDADASLVEIFVKPDADRIIVSDDGHGMDKDEFVSHFERISTSAKRISQATTLKFDRPKIGKIGIGFIAANEICEVIEIYSTKAGSSDVLYVRIDFEELKKPQEERIQENQDVVKADYFGEVSSNADIDDHYTQLFLTKVKGPAKHILASAGTRSSSDENEAKAFSIFGLEIDSVNDMLRTATFRSWQDYDAYSETALQVALNVPVEYHKEWIPHQARLKKFVNETEQLGFNVEYDGVPLRKPIVFSGVGKNFVRTFSFKGKEVSARGYFYAQHGTIKPLELQGVLVRIRHAAVGDYDQTFLDFSQSESPLIQKWVSCEIWADDRLEAAMNIDRTTLRDTHPAYVEFRELFHNELRKTLKKARSEIYQAVNNERKPAKARAAVSQLSNVVQRTLTGSTKKSAQEELRLIEDLPDEELSGTQLVKNFSVVQLFEIVVRVVKDCLPQKQQERFLSQLLRELREGTRK